MNPLKEGSYKDAIFISTHKFIGGVQCPGLLVVKKNLIKNKVPFQPGKLKNKQTNFFCIK
jgi:selenocysteine lyase/cysteine desulfurase